MGLAASQARLLFITTRQADVSFKLEKLCSDRLALGKTEERIEDEYERRLEASKFQTLDGADVSYANLMGLAGANAGRSSVVLYNAAGQVVADSKTAAAAKAAGINPDGGVSSAGGLQKFASAMGVSPVDKPMAEVALEGVKSNDGSSPKAGPKAGYDEFVNKLKGIKPGELEIGYNDYKKDGSFIEVSGQTLYDIASKPCPVVFEGSSAANSMINNLATQLSNFAIGQDYDQKDIDFAVKVAKQIAFIEGGLNENCDDFEEASQAKSGITGKFSHAYVSEDARIAMDLSMFIKSFYLALHQRSSSSSEGNSDLAAILQDFNKYSDDSVTDENKNRAKTVKKLQDYYSEHWGYMGNSSSEDKTGTDNVTISAKLSYFATIYKEMCANGYTTEFLDDNLKNEDVMNQYLENGQIRLSDGLAANSSKLNQVSDVSERDEKEIENWLKKEKLKLKNKETELDNQQTRYQTEMTSLETEYNSVKSIISKNIERSFVYCQS